MKTSMRTKLAMLEKRHSKLSQLMSDPNIIDDQNQFREFAKEYAKLDAIVAAFKEFHVTEESVKAAEALLKDDDENVRDLAKEELEELSRYQQEIEDRLKVLLLPKDPNDDRNIFLEIRAGTGGDEAALFAGDLFRMYSRYVVAKNWKIEIVTQHLGDHGGYKEIVVRILGQGVYSQLKFESGAHRVQRVPLTESQGRIHTSTCTVAILPEAEEIDTIEINPADLKIDTFRSSGAGGQHVNTTDSAIRITHIPTGTVVECQEERSQHKNRAKAMSVLRAKILAAQRAAQEKEQAETRRDLVGSGERSERIRTYNFPQARMTDHRINLTLYKLPQIMEGDLDELISSLIREHQADLLTEVDE